MKINAIHQFNALPEHQQELELIKERARQSFNRNNFSGYHIPAPKSEIGQYLEQHVKREFLWADVIKRVTNKLKWKKLV